MATYPSPTLQDLTVNGAASLADVSSAAATITGGTIDGTPIGATAPADVHATTINSTGAATLASVSTASATLTGGTVDGVTIGGTTPEAVHATDLSASGTVSGAGFTSLLSPYALSSNLASTSTGKGISLIGWPAGFGITVAPTNQFFEQNGAAIHRFNDRIFLGGATAADGKYPPVALDWFTAYQETLGYSNSTPLGMLFVSTNTNYNSSVAAQFAAQSLDVTSSGAACIGVTSFAVNNNATLATDAWAYYGEAHLTNSTVSSVYGMELDTLAESEALSSTPYVQGNVVGLQIAAGAGVQAASLTASISGTTLTVTACTNIIGYNIQVGSIIYGVGVTSGTIVTALGTGTGGIGTYTVNNSQTVASEHMVATPQHDASAAIQIQANPLKFKAGIVFGNTALTGCDGVSGIGTAIAMAIGHQVIWQNSAGGVVGSIRTTNASGTTATGINFTGVGLQVSGPGGDALAYFDPVANTANYLRFTASASGSGVAVVADGSDTNVGLTIQTKGTGRLGVNYAASTAGTPASFSATRIIPFVCNGVTLFIPADTSGW